MAGDPGAGINRYSDLLNEIPRGSFYSQRGVRVPYQDKPHDLVIQTTAANRTFGIFINSVFVGTTISDSGAIARFSATLVLGNNDITLEDDVTAQRITTYADARHMHTALAAVAQVIESIDVSIQDGYNARCLQTVGRNEIDDVWGKKLISPNSPSYQHETYRELLQEVHQGYRLLGGRRQALDNLVGAYTTATPLLLHLKDMGWAVGTSFIQNPRFQERNREQFTRTSAIPGVVVDSVSPMNPLGAGTLDYIFASTSLQWKTPGGSSGALVDVSAGGEFSLPGVAVAARIDGRVNGTFNIASTNANLRLNIDGRGSIDIALTVGGARTGIQVAADINTALAADTRYGAPYNAVATVITTTRVRLTAPQASVDAQGENSTIVLEHCTADAYTTVLGFPWIHSTLIAGELIGSTSFGVVSSDAFPDADTVTGTFQVLMARGTAREEIVEITGNNRTSDTLTGVALTIAKSINDKVELLGAFPYLISGSDNFEQGITVTVDETILPGGNDSETVTLFGSNISDNWLASNCTAAYQPNEFFDFFQLSLANNGGGDTTLEAEATARAFQFLEWPFRFSIWVKNLHTASVTIVPGANYGSGWVEGTPVAIASRNTTDGDVMTPVTMDLIPPATATEFRVRIRHDAAASGRTIEVNWASLVALNVSALFLGTHTTPRYEHRIFFGEAAYIWSPDELLASEESLIGLDSPNPPGHIDYGVPVHVPVDRFDVSLYDGGGNGVDIRGAFDEAELASGAYENFSLEIRTPARRSYLAPVRTSPVIGEVLSFPSPPAAPWTASLLIESDEDQDASILFADGIPVPNNTWQFNTSTEIEITSGFNETARYTFDYQALTQWTSPVIDLSSAFADFVWYADLATWARIEPENLEVVRTVQLQVNPQTRRAVLPDFSNGDKTSMSLIENDGLVLRTLVSSKYRLVDNKTVQIESDVFKSTSVYRLTFTALRSRPAQVPVITLEMRQSTDAVSFTSWEEIEKDQVLSGGYRYLQYRVTVGNIVDTRDFRLLSASAKGLNLFGVTGTVPILRP